MANVITTYPSELDFGLMQSDVELQTAFSFVFSASGTFDIAITIECSQADANVALNYNGRKSSNMLISAVTSGMQKQVTLIADPIGSPSVDGVIGFYFRRNGVFEHIEKHIFTLRRARVFNFPVDWVDGVQETYSFKTDIVTGRSGVEYRSAVRHNPKVVKAFTVATSDPESTSKLIGCVSSAMPYPFIVPDHVRIAYQTANFSRGQSIPLFPKRHTPSTNPEPEYFFDEAMNIYTPHSTRAKTDIFSGDRMFSGQICHMDENPSVEYVSDDSAKMSVSFVSHHLPGLLDTEDGIDLNIVDIPSHESFLQMFALPPTRRSYLLDFDYVRSFVDNERGMVDRFRNQKFTQKIYTHEFENIDCREANHIIRFFCSHRGRFKPFVISTWNNDFQLATDTVVGSDTIVVSDTSLYYNYRRDPAYRTLAIHTNNGKIFTAAIADGGLAISGGNTIVTLVEPVRKAFAINDVAHVSLAPFVRFASDNLDVTWHSDRTASITIKFATIPIPDNKTL